MIKLDLHVHTCYSRDSRLSLEKLSQVLKKKKIDCVAITDHNEIKGALEYRNRELGRVIIGEEITTNEGEIIGLFIEEKISPGLSPEETIYQIKNQGGLVYVPHPFDRLRKSAITQDVLNKIKDKIDIIEVFNSRNVFRKDNEKAQTFAKINNINQGVGTDAHKSLELGNAYLILDEFESKEEFLNNLKSSSLFTKRSPLFVHLLTKIDKII